jgi:FtsP/CotA-like multicopper oxidase with cupredoxin domain
VHHDDVYGDINLVNGVPYPRMEVQPKWYRLRLLNSGIDRPYLIKIKDAQGL